MTDQDTHWLDDATVEFERDELLHMVEKNRDNPDSSEVRRVELFSPSGKGPTTRGIVHQRWNRYPPEMNKTPVRVRPKLFIDEEMHFPTMVEVQTGFGPDEDLSPEEEYQFLGKAREVWRNNVELADTVDVFELKGSLESVTVTVDWQRTL